MANRSGGGSTAAIGLLQQARESLMQQLPGVRIDCAVTDRGLALYAYPPPPKKGRFGRLQPAVQLPTEWNGFPVVDKTKDDA